MKKLLYGLDDYRNKKPNIDYICLAIKEEALRYRIKHYTNDPIYYSLKELKQMLSLTIQKMKKTSKYKLPEIKL